MATFAIGDVHGNLRALEDLLEKLTPVIGEEDTLVFLGDYIDRGPDTAGCIARIIRLREESGFPVITLLGNHEEWMLKTLRDYHAHSWILGMEAFHTIASYSAEAATTIRQEAQHSGLALVTEKPALPYELFFQKVPERHVAFLTGLRPYYRTGEVVCVHGGLDPSGGPIEVQRQEDLIWGNDDFPQLYRGPDDIAYGHMNNAVLVGNDWPRPHVLDNHSFGLDTISHGVLTAMRFPDHQIFQSRRFP